MNLIIILLTGILSENIIINKFMGAYYVNQFIDDKKKISEIVAINVIVALLTSLINNVIYNDVLVPNDITYLKTFIFMIIILIITGVLLLLFKLLKREATSDYFKLIILNNVIFGSSILMIQTEYNVFESLSYVIGIGIGYIFLSYILKTINERMERSFIAKPFRGLPMYFITLFVIAMLFTRYIFG